MIMDVIQVIGSMIIIVGVFVSYRRYFKMSHDLGILYSNTIILIRELSTQVEEVSKQVGKLERMQNILMEEILIPISNDKRLKTINALYEKQKTKDKKGKK